MKNEDMHVWAAVATAAVVVLIGTSVYALNEDEIEIGGDRMKEFEFIEAELAMKSEHKTQPDKAPPPPKPPDEVIGGDAKAKAEVCKSDAECPKGQSCKKGTCVAENTKDDSTTVQMPPRRYTDDDATAGEVKLPDLGQFDGSERGFAQRSSGHPYSQDIAADVHEFFEYPELLKGQGSVDVCVRLHPDGKMSELKIWTPSGNSEIDDSGQRAIKKTMDKRNENPTPVPTELLAKGITTKYLCFRLTP